MEVFLLILIKILSCVDIKTTEKYAHLQQGPINKGRDDVSLNIKKIKELLNNFINRTQYLWEEKNEKTN